MIVSYVLIEVVSILADVVTESASDGLGLVICFSVLLEKIKLTVVFGIR